MSYDAYVDFTKQIKKTMNDLSYSQQLEILSIVVNMMKDSNPTPKHIDDNFVNLSFDDNRSADTILDEIYNCRSNSARFGEDNALFD